MLKNSEYAIKAGDLWKHKDGGIYEVNTLRSVDVEFRTFLLVFYTSCDENGKYLEDSDTYCRTIDHFRKSFKFFKEEPNA